MSQLTENPTTSLKVSKMAENLIGSEIIKLAGEIKQKISQGEEIFNYTIGDFNPELFPIPTELKELIIQAYQDNHTNYPAANGIEELRNAVSKLIADRLELNYSPNEVLIAGGSRPLIYAAYQAIVDPGDTVLFPVPSWNNNHYSHLSHAKAVMIETSPENNFMPTTEELAVYIPQAQFLALCSPLNPTGTVFQKEQLLSILDLVEKENEIRQLKGEKPLYVLYDQIYWMLTLGDTEHYNPVSLKPSLRNYVIFIDGMSKAFAATGVRVGWAFGPEKLIGKMKSILGHVGAWAPKAEQVAVANYLNDEKAVSSYLTQIKSEVHDRLDRFYKGFQALKSKGYRVDAIPPQAAIYLTVKLDLIGQTTAEGKVLSKTEDVTDFVLNKAGLAIVPFYAFGADKGSVWYRLSVGTAKVADIETMFQRLAAHLSELS